LEYTKVAEFYNLNHLNQTYELVQKIKSEYLPIGRWKYDIFEVINLMDEIIDDSDPDTQRSQIYHFLQTGEACRKAFPDKDWFHLLGFIHDLGKVSAHAKMHNLPQWAVVGDTFPVGCAFSEKCVFPDYFKLNPDFDHEVYSTKLGIYSEKTGFDNLQMSWGHDEYLYQVLVHNKCTMPEEALYVIRYHSFYPWHQRKAYSHFASEKDIELLPLVRAFQKCDLYSKVEQDIVIEDLLPYYQGLIKKYLPSTILEW